VAENTTSPVNDDKAPQTPELVDLELGGKTVKVTKEAAEAFTAFRESNDTRFAGLEQQIRSIPRPQAPPAAPSNEYDYSTAILTDTKSALDHFGKDLKDQIVNQITEAYSTNQRAEKFWNNFYKKNKDLSEDEDGFLVQSVLNANMGSLGDLPTTTAIVKLGDLVRGQIARIKGDSGGDQTKLRRQHSEAPGTVRDAMQGGPGQDGNAAPQPDNVKSLSTMLAERANRRAQAGRGKSA
jgi:hypothetical protein